MWDRSDPDWVGLRCSNIAAGGRSGGLRDLLADLLPQSFRSDVHVLARMQPELSGERGGSIAGRDAVRGGRSRRDQLQLRLGVASGGRENAPVPLLLLPGIRYELERERKAVAW
jgi:hypothetical protein